MSRRSSGGRKARGLGFAEGTPVKVSAGPHEGKSGVVAGGHAGYVQLQLSDGGKVNLRQSQITPLAAAAGEAPADEAPADAAEGVEASGANGESAPEAIMLD